MMQRLQRGFAALALVALPGGVLPVRDTDGMVPDLEITVVGIKDPGKPREVTLQVTNVGPAWADHTAATVRAEPAAAGEVLQGRDVLDLSPIGQEQQQNTPSRFEFTYTLAAPCGGQEVKIRASLTAGKDWEGDAETNLANNVIPRPGHDGVVCPGQTNTAPPASKPQGGPATSLEEAREGGLSSRVGSVLGPGMTLEEARERGLSSQIDFDAIIPEHLRPGRHTLQFDPVEAATRGRVRSTSDAFGSGCRGNPEPEYPLVAGFDNFTLDDPTNLSGCSVRKVWQVAVRFNLAQLREVRAAGPYFPIDARLAYRETPFLQGPVPGYPETDGPPSFLYHEEDPEGGRHRTFTCHLRLARPSVDWSGGGDLLPYGDWREPRETGRWTGLLGDVHDMLNDPETERRGFVLLAFTEDMNEDNGACKSKIEDLALFYVYVIAEP